MTKPSQPGDRGVMLIGGLKLAEGSLFAVFALCLLKVPPEALVDAIENATAMLQANGGSGFRSGLLQKLTAITETQLRQIGGLILLFAALLLTQGIGLLMKKRWAEYFTVVLTGLLIPVELYELIRHFAVANLVLLAINVAIVWYLIWVLVRQKARNPVAA